MIASRHFQSCIGLLHTIILSYLNGEVKWLVCRHSIQVTAEGFVCSIHTLVIEFWLYFKFLPRKWSIPEIFAPPPPTQVVVFSKPVYSWWGGVFSRPDEYFRDNFGVKICQAWSKELLSRGILEEKLVPKGRVGGERIFYGKLSTTTS